MILEQQQKARHCTPCCLALDLDCFKASTQVRRTLTAPKSSSSSDEDDTKRTRMQGGGLGVYPLLSEHNGSKRKCTKLWARKQILLSSLERSRKNEGVNTCTGAKRKQQNSLQALNRTSLTGHPSIAEPRLISLTYLGQSNARTAKPRKRLKEKEIWPHPAPHVYLEN